MGFPPFLLFPWCTVQGLAHILVYVVSYLDLNLMLKRKLERRGLEAHPGDLALSDFLK